MEILRERNTATTIYFPLYKSDGSAYATSSDWTPASGDAEYSEDGAVFASTTNTVTHEGNGIWSLALVAGELDGKVTVVYINDTEIMEQTVIIQTWGDDSAGIPFNAIADYVIRRSYQSANDSTRGDTKAFRSLLGAIAKQVNKIAQSGGTLTIYEDDDTTALGTQTITSAAGNPITGLDTT